MINRLYDRFERAVASTGNRWLIPVFVIAVIRRIPVMKYWYVAGGDQAIFLTMARNILQGRFYYTDSHPLTAIETGFTTFAPSGHPILIALFSTVTGNILSASALLSLLCGLGSLFLLVKLTEKIWGRGLAFMTGCLAALHPVLAEFSALHYREMTFAFFFMAALYSLYHSIQNPCRRNLLLTGFLSAWMALVRPDGFLYFFAIAAFLFLVLKTERRKILYLFLGYIILALPFHIHKKLQPHERLLPFSNPVFNMEYGSRNDLAREMWKMGPDGRMEAYSEINNTGVLEYIGDHITDFPGRYLKVYLGKGPVNRYYRIFPGIFVIFIFSGLILLPPLTEKKRFAVFILIYSALPFLYTPLSHLEARYLLSPLHLYLIPASLTIILVTSGIVELFRFRKNRPVFYIMILLLIIVQFIFFTGKSLYDISSAASLEIFYRIKTTGKYLEEHSSPNASISSFYSSAGFFSNRNQYMLPDTNYERYVKWIRERKIEYVVVDKNFIIMYRPQMIQLAYPLRCRNEFRLILTDPEERLFLYKSVEEDREMWQNLLPEATRRFHEISQETGPDWLRYLSDGRFYRKNHDYRKAVRELRKIKWYHNFEIYLQAQRDLYFLLRNMGRPEEVETSAKILDIFDNSFPYNTMLYTDEHERSGQFQEAEADYEKAIQKEDTPYLRFRYGQLFERQEKYSKALEQYLEADQVKPHPEHILGIIRCLEKLGLYTEMRDACLDAMKRYPHREEFEKALKKAELSLEKL